MAPVDPAGALADRTNADGDGFEKLMVELKAAGATQFGSLWAWRVLENGTFKVTNAGNANLPLAHGQTALLGIDRPDPISTNLEQPVNGDLAPSSLATA